MSSGVDKVPAAVAVIMDGNGRWARERGRPRMVGHRVGAESVRVITRTCARLGVESLILYAFSLENFSRPRDEVAFLMRLLRRFLVRERREIMENRIRFRVIGRRELLPRAVQDRVEELETLSRENDGMNLTLALAYGGRAEIVDVARGIARDVAAGRLAPEEVDEEAINRRLYLPAYPDVDLLIRTAGEMRVSNFLLWQISYAELHVSPVCWPDFREEQLARAFADYRGRVRKFGGLVGKGER